MSERAVPQPGLARVILVSLGVVQATDGLYALISPRGFYDDFPLGRGWVAAYPEYSEHLVRDVGGLFLGTGVLMLIAAVWLQRRLVIAALVTWLLFAVPHTTYHLLNPETDAALNAITLLATVVLPIWLLVLLARGAAPARPGGMPSAARVALIDKPTGVVARASFRESKRRYGMVMDPMRAYAHTPLLLAGYGGLEMAVERSHHCPERLKELGVMRAAMLSGCEWCLDFGSAELLAKGISEDELKDLVRWRESERFSPLDKLVLAYAEGMSRTPVDVADQLVAQLRAELGDPALVELTNVIALENHRSRFNWALGIGSQGFSEGSYCVPPEPPVAASTTM